MYIDVGLELNSSPADGRNELSPLHQNMLFKTSLKKQVSSTVVQAAHSVSVVKEHLIIYKPFLSFLDFHLEMKAWEDLTHFQTLEPVMKKTPR